RVMNANVSSMRIALTAIRANPHQPRKTFDPIELDELAKSILVAGKLHQPIKVRPIAPEGDVQFEIVMGERRYRAHRLLVEWGHTQFSAIDARVEKMDDTEMAIQAIVENLQRSNVNPVEEALAFQDLIVRGMKDLEIAQLVGIATHRVRERLALVNLD